MFKTLWYLVKSLGIASYRNTWGLIERCAKNAEVGKNDNLDRSTAGRLVTYAAWIIFTFFLPEYAIMLSIFRSLVVLDVVSIIGSIFIDAAAVFKNMAEQQPQGQAENLLLA